MGTRRPVRRFAAHRLVLVALTAAAWLPTTGCESRTTRTREDASNASVRASRARLPLPEVAPGARLEDVLRAIGDWPPGHRFTQESARPEGWEWSGPDGRRVEAYLSGSVVIWCRVSRTWGDGVPAVEGSDLPRLDAARTLEDFVHIAGAGLLTERSGSVAALGSTDFRLEETYRWRIEDRGLDSGLFLTAIARDGVIAISRHPWSRR